MINLELIAGKLFLLSTVDNEAILVLKGFLVMPGEYYLEECKS